MTKSIQLGLLVSSRIGDKKSGRVFFNSLPPSLIPHAYNDHEPIIKRFDGVESALACWGSTFLWSRRSPRIVGHVLTSHARAHDSIYLSISDQAFKLDELLGFFEKIEYRFGLDIGYVHRRSSKDTKNLDHYDHFIMPFSQGLTTHDLREGLPGLCWGTLLGRVYTEIFNDRMADVPVHAKQEIGSCTYLQLTESIDDVDRKREEYEAIREATKKHLNSNVFRVLGRRGPYRIPEFKLS